MTNNFHTIRNKYHKFKNKRKKIEVKKIEKIKECNKCSFIIIVPFRNDLENVRFEQLLKFTEFMSKHKFKVFVINQNTLIKNKKFTEKFNRGALLNVGFLLAKKEKVDYVIFHDVDLIPDKEILPYYKMFPSSPIHLAKYNPKYTFDLYFGGVNSFNMKDFEKINGFPNNYWGWGGEDDELYDRLVDNNLEILVPKKGSYTELEHNKPTKQQILEYKEKMLLRMDHNKWKENGLNNIKYKLLDSLDKKHYKIFDVKIYK